MQSNAEIKSYAKERMKANWLNCVLAMLSVTLISMLLSGIAMTGTTVRTGPEGTVDVSMGPLYAPVSTLSALILAPFAMGLALFFIRTVVRGEDGVDLLLPLTSVKDDLSRKIAAAAYAYLYTMLWTLALIIPGIIKSFAYALTNYIVVDHPGVQAKDAFRISERVMKGKKMSYFLFQMSFVGWYILGLMTLGIGLILWVNPYVHAATAEWYDQRMSEALREGVITQGQLDGTEPIA